MFDTPSGASLSAHEQREVLRLFIAHAPVALAMFDCDMRYVFATQRWMSDHGLTESVIGRSHYDLFPDIPPRWREAHRRGLAGETLGEEEDRFDRADGKRQWLRWELRPWLSDAGEVGGIVIFREDITSRKLADEERDRLRAEIVKRSQWLHAEQRYRALLNSAPDAMIVVDAKGRIVLANSQAAHLFGYESEDLLERPIEVLLSEDSRAIHVQHRAGYFSNPRVRAMGSGSELFGRRKDGSTFPAEVSLSPLQTEEGLFVSSAIRDISERKEMERKLREEAQTDALTGAATRRHFRELAQRELARARRHGGAVSLVAIDVDHFKAINDGYGHATGDLVLQALARSCQRLMREEDVLGRLGGDEFSLLLPDTGHFMAINVAERMRTAIARAEVPTGGAAPLRFTASLGVTASMPEDAGIDDLLMRADKALYSAKRDGRNTVRMDTGRQ